MFTLLVDIFIALKMPRNIALHHHPKCSVASNDKIRTLCLHVHRVSAEISLLSLNSKSPKFECRL
jgi:hypothetical protein